MKYIFRPLKDLEDKYTDVLYSMGYIQANRNAKDIHYLLAYVDNNSLSYEAIKSLRTNSETIMTFPHIHTTCDKDSILGIAKRNDYTPIATIEEFLTYLVISREAATQYLHNL